MKINITDFGAAGGTKELQTEKIQLAVDKCFENGGGKVIIPEGDYRVGSIRLRSRVVLHLQKNAHLMGSENPRDYDVGKDFTEPYRDEDKTTVVWTPPVGLEVFFDEEENVPESRKQDNFDYINKCLSSWNNGVIKAVDACDISIVCDEGAYIDGINCFDETGENNYRGPHAINIHRCKNVHFSGVHIKNSANWAFAIFDSSNIVVENALVEAGHDGVHITTCDNVLIKDSEFYCGDDCVSGIDNLNVTVYGCVLNTACSAIRFGGTNFLAENCRIYGPAKFLFRGSLSDEEKRSGVGEDTKGRFNMLSLFTYYSDFTREIRHEPSNIKIKNCTVENADRFLHYNFSGNEPWQKNKPLSSIEFENVTAENVNHPITAYGDKDCKISLSIKNCKIKFSDEAENLPLMYLCNAEKVLFENTVVSGFKNDFLIKKWDNGGDIVSDGLICEGFDGKLTKIADEPFKCKPI